jgi:hypothetical protein
MGMRIYVRHELHVCLREPAVCVGLHRPDQPGAGAELLTLYGRPLRPRRAAVGVLFSGGQATNTHSMDRGGLGRHIQDIHAPRWHGANVTYPLRCKIQDDFVWISKVLRRVRLRVDLQPSC